MKHRLLLLHICLWITIGCQSVEPEPTYRKDVTPVELLHTSTWVFSSTNVSNINRKTVSIKLPPNTLYWVYWIGVGQESVDQLKATVTQISKAGQAITVNPVIAFGLELLPYLPQVTAKESINYYLLDKPNANLFITDPTCCFNYYKLGYGVGTVSDYRRVAIEDTPSTADGYLYLGLHNDNLITGLPIDVQVIAFVKK